MSEYGADKFKPFFGTLFEANGFHYVTQVSHPKPRHISMKQQKDFFKVFDPADPKRLLAIVNLNYMFPVPSSILEPLRKDDIEHHRSFKSESEKSKYIDLLNRELTSINKLNLTSAAIFCYNNKYALPDSKIAKRCLDFKALEEYAQQYQGQKNTLLPYYYAIWLAINNPIKTYPRSYCTYTSSQHLPFQRYRIFLSSQLSQQWRAFLNPQNRRWDNAECWWVEAV